MALYIAHMRGTHELNHYTRNAIDSNTFNTQQRVLLKVKTSKSFLKLLSCMMHVIKKWSNRPTSDAWTVRALASPLSRFIAMGQWWLVHRGG
ncbi:unnamed protein product [Leptosia nina]|uniref:Uncharacterized protein n=1 Tax=Leptosia nina TaxID=320188 RepID=A0AAV1ITF2_9NEOP